MLDNKYDHLKVEEGQYEGWVKKGYFTAGDTSKKPYCLVIPPPNVTGKLHLGHSWDNTLQDIITRYKRMCGFDTLYLPGMDHAGIATQAKVDQRLKEQGVSRYDIGREKFLEQAWAWKEEYAGFIRQQWASMGIALDYTRERFTLDEGLSKAVRREFVQLYKEGLIYQGERIINWDPAAKTALSNIEVIYKPTKGYMYHFKYDVVETGRQIVVATTRPETMFGDVCVVVHPDDERYKDLVGKNVILPVVNRVIPLFADEYVDSAFGTGAVKVTPAHDPNDYEMGLRHNLEQVKVLSNTGKMLEGAGKYEGMDRYECRKALVKELEEIGALVSIEDHEHAVGHCSRCHSTIEPMISTQWFVKMDTLAKPAADAVRDGRIKFVPERFTKIYCQWLDNIRDWCISRQLWWGHRIPAWYCDDCGETTVSRDDICQCPKCGSKNVRQDEDVLDTWFSSGLWPFETMGWPEETAELKHFYPTATLVTGYDIIFFWVARMVMMGLEFGKDIPFKTVYIHGLVRDSQGRKMSKSLGNGIDPLEMIEEYGADSLRFMLITGNTPGNDMRFYNERVESARNFANKLWNASRFMLMNLEGFDKSFVPTAEDYTMADKWILSRFAKTAQGVTENLEKYELGEAGRLIYEFIWSEFCDWYIELSKARLYDKENVKPRQTAQYVLGYVLERTLRLLHPFMPFITEEIWQHIPHEGKSIMVSQWPAEDKTITALIDEASESSMTTIMETIKTIRALRLEVNAAPSKKSEVVLNFTDESLRQVFADNEGYLTVLASAEPVTHMVAGAEKPENAMAGVVNGVEIFLPLKDLIDVEKETARLNGEMAKLEKEISRLDKKLSNQGFLAKAPADVVAGEKEKLAGYQEKMDAVKARLEDLAKL